MIGAVAACSPLRAPVPPPARSRRLCEDGDLRWPPLSATPAVRARLQPRSGRGRKGIVLGIRLRPGRDTAAHCGCLRLSRTRMVPGGTRRCGGGKPGILISGGRARSRALPRPHRSRGPIDPEPASIPNPPRSRTRLASPAGRARHGAGRPREKMCAGQQNPLGRMRTCSTIALGAPEESRLRRP